VLLGSLPLVYACAAGGGGPNAGLNNGQGGAGGAVGLCGPSPVAHISFNIQSASHNNDPVAIDQMRFDSGDFPGVTHDPIFVTSMEIADRDAYDNVGNHAELVFKGFEPASEALGTSTIGLAPLDTVSIHVFLGSESYFCCNSGTSSFFGGTLSVSSFGGVGGLISGSFEGQFASEVTGVPYAMLTNGSFAVTNCGY
jgi:hypothetical protein